MDYCAINNLEGTRLLAVIPATMADKFQVVDDDVCVNRIVDVHITRCGNVEVSDENGHTFLVVECQDYDDACKWAVREIGHTTIFTTENLEALG